MPKFVKTELIHFILAIVGVLFSCATLGLLIYSQIKQKWILYEFLITGSRTETITSPFTTTVTVNYNITTTADIGIWETDYVTVSEFDRQIPGTVENSEISGTLNSATTGYFSEAAVKACRALAIMASISTFTTVVMGVAILIATPLKVLSGKPSKLVNIVIIVSAAFTVFTATVALIVVRTQFKNGMSIDTSYYVAIASDVVMAVALALFSVSFYLSTKNQVSPSTKVPVRANKITVSASIVNVETY